MSWRTVRIGDLGKVVTGKTPPTKQRQFYGEEYPFITPSDLDYDSYRVWTTTTKLSDEARSKFQSQFIPKNAVTFTCIASVGKIGITTTDSLTNQQINSIVVNDEHNWLFVYYLLRYETNRIQRICSGVAAPIINKGDFEKMQVKIPNELSSEHRIASILSAYDDLIENNRRRIRLLEQAARLLYKEWFVHLRFLGHEHVKITDGIPEGWERKPLSDVADITMGQSPKSIHYNQDEDGLPFHQGVTDFGIRFPKHKTYCKVKNRTAEPGDILFSVRAPVGRINVALDKIVIGRGLAAIQSKLNQQNLLFYALKSRFFREDLMGGGSIFAAVTKKDLYNVELALPSGPVARTFSEQVKPMDEQIKNLHTRNAALTKARDLLLPRLMNGSLVCDYEQEHICDSRPKVTEATA